MSKSLLYILLFTLVLGFTAKAQKVEKVYFDKHWIKTNKKSSEFYRTIQKVKDSLKHTLYLVHDYYNTDTLQMWGFYLDENMKEKIGTFYYYYPCGKLKSQISYNKYGYNGEKKVYFESGSIKSKAVYKNDTILSFQGWFENKKTERICNYKNGERDGTAFYYYPNGKCKRVVIYKEGDMVSGKCYTSEGIDTNYYPHFIESKFPGGFNKFIEYEPSVAEAKLGSI